MMLFLGYLVGVELMEKVNIFFRVLKSNKNEQVNFKEEKEYLKSFCRIV